MNHKSLLLVFGLFLLVGNVWAQPAIPRESNGASVSQIVGDTQIAINYHRPNLKGRTIWGCETKDYIPKGGVTYPCLVPFGQVWRSGANENTTIEFSRDVTINGQALPKGKYGFHTIPGKKSWILIFSKVNDAWGSFSYDEKKDQLRVTVSPMTSKILRESLMYEFENVTNRSTNVVVSWEKIRVPFTVDVGDVTERTLAAIRSLIANRKAEDFRSLNQGANYIYTFRVAKNYDEALGWLETSLKIREGFGSLNTKARILAELGRKSEAILTAERAIQVGKAATPPAETGDLERLLADWRKK